MEQTAENKFNNNLLFSWVLVVKKAVFEWMQPEKKEGFAGDIATWLL